MNMVRRMTTMREALREYFEVNHFGVDGGYSAKWVDFKLGPVPFLFPNTEGRKKAVRFHDLNHVLTGYRTDTVSEFEISAWEIGAGCGSFAAAWVINLGGLAAGLFTAPLRVFRAFVRGSRQRASYALGYDTMMEREVDDVRRELGVTDEAVSPRLTDLVRFAFAALAGIGVGLLMAVTLLSPVTLFLWLRWRMQSAAS
jgi:hypothetical protein